VTTRCSRFHNQLHQVATPSWSTTPRFRSGIGDALALHALELTRYPLVDTGFTASRVWPFNFLAASSQVLCMRHCFKMIRAATECDPAQMVYIYAGSRQFTVSEKPCCSVGSEGLPFVEDLPVLITCLVAANSTKPDQTAVVICCYLLSKAIKQRS
jgi:hypothetical protein